MRTALVIGFAYAALVACNDARFVSGTSEMTMSGALTQTVHGRVQAGYGAAVAGGRYSIGVTWPEDHPEQQKTPMSSANQTPLLAWFTDSQPTTGTHRISPIPYRGGKEISALMTAPHLDTEWESDSGSLRITVSDRRTQALAGTFDLWMRCTQDCPCAVVEGCQVRVRGSLAVP